MSPTPDTISSPHHRVGHEEIEALLPALRALPGGEPLADTVGAYLAEQRQNDALVHRGPLHFDLLTYLFNRPAPRMQRLEDLLEELRNACDRAWADPRHAKVWTDIVALAFQGALQSGCTPLLLIAALAAQESRSATHLPADF